jgi:tetratricopeptide (TPR) repeat protein
MSSMTDTVVDAAIAAINSESATIAEKIEMLIELANDLQRKPKDPGQLWQAISLHNHALTLCGSDYPLLRARAMTGTATALRTIPADDADLLLQAKDLYNSALPILQEHASPEEIAETEMNLGLVFQALVPYNQARLVDGIQAYQRALRVFTGSAYPQEHAILQNNIAIAYLSMPLSQTGDDMRQALAVQAFQQALEWVTLIDHPNEYAMLQNNLGNALQYLPSTHPVDNNWKAISAYDEALKVRNARDTPMEYATTLANKANALANLPDPDDETLGNAKNLAQAKAYYQEAKEIFERFGQHEQAQTVAQAIDEL